MIARPVALGLLSIAVALTPSFAGGRASGLERPPDSGDSAGARPYALASAATPAITSTIPATATATADPAATVTITAAPSVTATVTALASVTAPATIIPPRRR